MHMNDRKRTTLTSIAVCASALLFLSVLLFFTILPTRQLIAFETDINEAHNGDASALMNDDMLFRDSFVQERIRYELLNFVFSEYKDRSFSGSSPRLDFAVARMTDYETERPIRAYYELLLLAKAYDLKDSITPHQGYYEKADMYYQRSLALVPDRQDTLYEYAIHLSNHGEENRAFDVLNSVLAEAPTLPETHYYLGALYAVKGQTSYDKALDYFEYSLGRGIDPDNALSINAYKHFFYYYYMKGDIQHFTVVTKRLALLDFSQKETYDGVIDYLEKSHSIPIIDFSQQ